MRACYTLSKCLRHSPSLWGKMVPNRKRIWKLLVIKEQSLRQTAEKEYEVQKRTIKVFKVNQKIIHRDIKILKLMQLVQAGIGHKLHNFVGHVKNIPSSSIVRPSLPKQPYQLIRWMRQCFVLTFPPIRYSCNNEIDLKNICLHEGRTKIENQRKHVLAIHLKNVIRIFGLVFWLTKFSGLVSQISTIWF
jgi:hypothetical protein